MFFLLLEGVETFLLSLRYVKAFLYSTFAFYCGADTSLQSMSVCFQRVSSRIKAYKKALKVINKALSKVEDVNRTEGIKQSC